MPFLYLTLQELRSGGVRGGLASPKSLVFPPDCAAAPRSRAGNRVSWRDCIPPNLPAEWRLHRSYYLRTNRMVNDHPPAPSSAALTPVGAERPASEAPAKRFAWPSRSLLMLIGTLLLTVGLVLVPGDLVARLG